MKLKLIFTSILIAALSVPPVVSFAEESDSAQSVKIVQTLFEQGVKAYSEGDYADALLAFRKAYAYVPEAVFLYNAARSAERLGNLEQALSLAKDAKTAEERPLPKPMAAKNDALITQLKATVAERKAEQERQRTGQWSWVGYSGVGTSVVGLGLIGGALYLGQSASSDIKKIGDITDTEIYAQKRDDIQSKQTTGQVFLYSGIGLAALGGSMIIWDLVSPGESPFSVAVSPNDLGFALSLTGEF